jgi:hypothetical protein
MGSICYALERVSNPLGEGIGGDLLRNRSNSSAMNLLRHMRVAALDRGLQEVVRSRHAMPIAA